MSLEERTDYWFHNNKPNRDIVDYFDTLSIKDRLEYLDSANVPKKTIEPYPLPNIVLDYREGEYDKNLIDLTPDDFVLFNYKSRPQIKAYLSN
jgi:hypothetical protein